MSSDPAIVTESLGKQYLIRHDDPRNRTFVEAAGAILASPIRRLRELRGTASHQERFWALRDVNIAIPEGGITGIIGRNGAGKSTLLKVLSRITKPTEGHAEVRGSVRSLLEVGIGFHPELTGRENVFLNGAILGMKRSEIRDRFDEIVAFAEVEQFVDTPVKRYSSGMYVRLAFAVAAHLEPDILLVDEVLAVGDARFQRRSLEKIRTMARSGRTVVIVSHNLRTISSLTSRCLYLDRGRVVADDATDVVVSRYLDSVEEVASGDLTTRTDRFGNGSVRFASIEIGSAGNQSSGHVAVGDDVIIRIRLRAAKRVSDVQVSLRVNGPLGEHLTLLSSALSGAEIGQLEGDAIARCSIPRLPLAPGRYSLDMVAMAGGELADWVQHGAELHVESGRFFEHGLFGHDQSGGAFYIDHHWSVSQEDGS